MTCSLGRSKAPDKRFESRYRAELHDRLTGPLYALAFMLIGYAALSAPRTTRQGRGAAIAGAVLGVVVLRTLGFFVGSLVARSPAFVPLAYTLPLGACLASVIVARRSHNLKQREWPWLTRMISAEAHPMGLAKPLLARLRRV